MTTEQAYLLDDWVRCELAVRANEKLPQALRNTARIQLRKIELENDARARKMNIDFELVAAVLDMK